MNEIVRCFNEDSSLRTKVARSFNEEGRPGVSSRAGGLACEKDNDWCKWVRTHRRGSRACWVSCLTIMHMLEGEFEGMPCGIQRFAKCMVMI